MKTKKPGATWSATTRGAIILLRQKQAMLRTWCDFWSTPFYSWLRRRVLRKGDAYDTYLRESDKLIARYDRISRRYGR